MITQIQEAAQDTDRKFSVRLDLASGYQFEADLGLLGVDTLTLDEPPPLGAGTGPNPARLLAAAVANCLASSLLFCLRKAHIEVEGLFVDATGTMARNERGRLRVTAINVTLRPQVAVAARARMARCLEIFEDYCPVTAAVRQGLDVTVTVEPA
jgi:organic hydroperoxide reductase OsmC/OhrA